MRDVSIVGIGQTRVAEHWDKSLTQLTSEAIRSALAEADADHVDAVYVGNMLSGELCGQQNLGALVADHAGLSGVEAMRVEAACCSGGAAFRAGYIAVASGMSDVVVVVGVEKLTDRLGDEVTAGLASAADAYPVHEHRSCWCRSETQYSPRERQGEFSSTQLARACAPGAAGL